MERPAPRPASERGRAALSGLERGNGNPSIDTVWALARTLNVPFGDLFDVTDDVLDYSLVATGGFSNDPQVEWTATRSGTYYIGVAAADAVDPDDPGAAVPDLEPYTVSAYKQRKKAKAKRKSSSK